MIGLRQLLFIGCGVLLQLAAAFMPVDAGYAEDALPGAAKALIAKYPGVSPKLQKNYFGAPIFLESFESRGAQQVDMYGVFNYPFEVVRDALKSPANWCDITSLHINIKACTVSKGAGQPLLTIYSGRKYYQPPADAYPLKLTFRLVSLQPDYLNISLSADQGPLRTKNHRIRLEAAPLDAGKSFVHFSYGYSTGSVANMAIKSYFATIARDKLGFSTTQGQSGKPVLIGGVRGAVERNTVRYYLALQSYLDTLNVPEGQRFEQRISHWYDLTARYPRQLKEVERSEYLSNKRREHANQVALQSELQRGAPSVSLGD